MAAFLIRRLLQLPLVLAVVLTLTFFMCLSVPGDPVKGDKTNPEVKRNKRAEWQLDAPLGVQFAVYLGHLSPLQVGEWARVEEPGADGASRWVWRPDWSGGWQWKRPDLRTSIVYGLDVIDILRSSLPVSIVLGVLAMTLALIMGTALGVVAAVWRNRWPDGLSLTLALVGVSLPSFVTATVLLILGSVALAWFPVGGWGSVSHIILPAFSLSLLYAAYIARLTRAGMLDCLNQDYIRTARAKGLPPSAVILKHAFRNAMLPVVSFLGPGFANILTGSFVVENIFTVPGAGSHFVAAVTDRDYFLILGTVLIYSTLLVIFNLVTDVAYGFLDPRIRVE